MCNEEGVDANDESGDSEEVQVRVAFEQQQADDAGHGSHYALAQEQYKVAHAIYRRHLQSVVYYCAECLKYIYWVKQKTARRLHSTGEYVYRFFYIIHIIIIDTSNIITISACWQLNDKYNLVSIRDLVRESLDNQNFH